MLPLKATGGRRMSYCVQCGVELSPALSRCPLCETVVYNPNQTNQPLAPSPYPAESPVVLEAATKKSFIFLISAAFALPASICILVDLLLNQQFTWSLFALGALFVVWVVFMVSVLSKKHKTYATIGTSAATLCGYLWVVERLTGGYEWFGHIALPVVLVLSLGILLFTASIRHRLLKELEIPAVILLFFAIFSLILELLLSSYLYHNLRIFWSPLVAAPCILIALILYYLQRTPTLKNALQKKFHF